MLLVADNLQITRPEIAGAIRDQNPAPLQALVEDLVLAGAEAIDLNTGPLGRHADRQMAFCVETVQRMTDLPIIIDTTNPLAMRAGLETNGNIAMINGVSSEPRRLATMLPLAVEFDVDIIVYVLDDHSQIPPGLEGRLAMALALFQRCRSAGLRADQIIFDPVVAPLLWQDGLQRNRELLEIIRRLPELLDFPVRTVAGLSNLTTGQQSPRARQQLEQAFLPMLASAGLSWLLFNIHHRETAASARICRSLLKEDIFAWALGDS